MITPDPPSFLQYLIPNVVCMLIPFCYARMHAKDRSLPRKKTALGIFLFSFFFSLASGAMLWPAPLPMFFLKGLGFATFSVASFFSMTWAYEKAGAEAKN